jgi:hypothetical protein
MADLDWLYRKLDRLDVLLKDLYNRDKLSGTQLSDLRTTIALTRLKLKTLWECK